jgi:hypothetical protein
MGSLYYVVTILAEAGDDRSHRDVDVALNRNAAPPLRRAQNAGAHEMALASLDQWQLTRG